MAIKSGSVSDFLKANNNPNTMLALSKSIIAKQPSTKVRDQTKRDYVLAIEMNYIEKNFDISKFPLAKKVL